MRIFARHAGAKVPEGAMRDRFERLAFEQLLQDKRNFRLATEAEFDAAPEWARANAARGKPLVCFKLGRSACARLHNFARRLAMIRQLAELAPAKQPHLTHAITMARRCVAKINHASFEHLASKACALARAYKQIENEADQAALCAEQVVVATGGRVWRRVVSVSALRAAGREFHNCLAQEHHGHPAQLRRGARQYWVLRGPHGEPLVVASTETPCAAHFIETRGPFNSVARDFTEDLALLATAIGMKMQPRPPRLPRRRPLAAPRVPAALEALRAMEPPCPCRRCVAQRTVALLLRVTAAS